MNDYPRMLFNHETRERKVVHGADEEESLYPTWKRKRWLDRELAFPVGPEKTGAKVEKPSLIAETVQKGRKWLRRST